MGTFGVRINQWLSFSPFRMKISKRQSIFFPGCSLMKLDNNILYDIYEFLKKYDSDCGLCLFCCSAPSYILGNNYLEKKQKVIAEHFKNNNIRKIYVACANCKEKLDYIKEKYNLQYETVFIYDVLADKLDGKTSYYPLNEDLMIQDPCRMRHEIKTMDNIRVILKKVKQNFIEPKFSKGKTVCCGNINMLHITAPEKSAKLCKLRNDQFMGKNIVSYCNGCLYAFAKLGTKGVHILELVFGKSKKNSFTNRIKFVLKNQIC